MTPSGPSAATPPDAGGTGNTGRAETALLRAVLHVLFGVWGLSVREVAPMLGGVSLRTLFHWRERPEAAAVDIALRDRLSALLALHKALRRIHPDATGQREWLQAAGDDGRTPLAVLMDGRSRDIRSLRDRVQGGGDGGLAGR